MSGHLQVTLGETGFAVVDKKNGGTIVDGHDTPEEAVAAASAKIKEHAKKMRDAAAALDEAGIGQPLEDLLGGAPLKVIKVEEVSS